MSTATDGGKKTEIDWNNRALPDGVVTWVYSECDECGHQIVTSPTYEMERMPSIYCGECENGPVMSVYAYEFRDDTVVYHPKYDGRPVPPEREDNAW